MIFGKIKDDRRFHSNQDAINFLIKFADNF